MKLLRNEREWQRYCREQTNKDPETTPKEFPCSVSTLEVQGTYFHCFVYLADMVPLAAAHGIRFPGAGEIEDVESSGTADYFTSTSAHILAIVETLVEVGVCTKQQYEASYSKFLSGVEQDKANKVRNLVGRLEQIGGKNE